MSAADWRRVSRRRHCPICGRPDWCLYAGPEGDPTAAICARAESAKRCGEAGWLHRLRDDPLRRPERRFVRHVPLAAGGTMRADLPSLAADYHRAAVPSRLNEFAASLGLSVTSLCRLGVGWSAEHCSWSFPMTDPAGNVLGIRLRKPNGFKFAVAGGREGLFLPSTAGDVFTSIYICEGPTDAAALLDMGFGNVAGRPSCTGGVRLLVELVRRRRPPGAVIVADGDEPGRRGACNLASVLTAYAPAVRVIAPPEGVKDARAWLRAGGGRQDVEQAIQAAPVRRLTVRATTKSAQRG
jgi:hypothetical protein